MISNDNFKFVARANLILFPKTAFWGYMGLHALTLIHFGEQNEAAKAQNGRKNSSRHDSK